MTAGEFQGRNMMWSVRFDPGFYLFVFSVFAKLEFDGTTMEGGVKPVDIDTLKQCVLFTSSLVTNGWRRYFDDPE